MVARAGFEPAPTGLKNRHPGPLGERAKIGVASQISTGLKPGCSRLHSHSAIATGNWFPIEDSNLDILFQKQTS